MATHGTSQVATCARRSAVSADDPVPAAKITAPGVPEWAVQRARITKAHRRGRAVVPADCRHWPSGRGQDDGPGAVGGGRTRDCCLGLPG